MLFTIFVKLNFASQYHISYLFVMYPLNRILMYKVLEQKLLMA